MLEACLTMVAGRIEDALQKERINLHKVVVEPTSNEKSLSSITFLEGETAVKEEFAKFSLSFSKKTGWNCRPLAKNIHQLPIGKTLYLSDFLRVIVESVLDELFEDGEVA